MFILPFLVKSESRISLVRLIIVMHIQSIYIHQINIMHLQSGIKNKFGNHEGKALTQ